MKKYRPRAEVLCFQGDNVLCQWLIDARRVEFPGGGTDPHESAVQAARREAFEEAGRYLYHVGVAHPPTTQDWPADSPVRNKAWAKGFDGSYTHWMTGITSTEPLPPERRHKDYQPFGWFPVARVLVWMEEEEKIPAAWSDDLAVRRQILRAHLEQLEPAGRQPVKHASFDHALTSWMPHARTLLSP